jgi:hypothetical protein
MSASPRLDRGNAAGGCQLIESAEHLCPEDNQIERGINSSRFGFGAECGFRSVELLLIYKHALATQVAPYIGHSGCPVEVTELMIGVWHLARICNITDTRRADCRSSRRLQSGRDG